ncbi:MAG: 3-dehydroquinate synthase family protein [Planctomycetota bacterium]|nr:3-dehydroquinate synthase family protein [Planctomycetota bacterium]
MNSLTIQLPPSPPRRYDVHVGPALTDQLGPLARAALDPAASRAFVVADAGLPQTAVDRARRSLHGAGFDVTAECILPREDRKSLDTAQHLLAALAATRHERRDPVIALGGGITGDLAGFVAAIYRRGTPVIQCPTTLLSMVDASVGGKTAVNLHDRAHLRKNLVGVFWQPAAVIADTALLATLPDRQLRAGLAECLKHALISADVDPSLADDTRADLPRLLRRDDAALQSLVLRNLRVKAHFVSEDEREEKPSAQGGRALLNLGHTFGHAIETVPSLSPDDTPASAPLHHGEAVALGLVAAAHTAAALSLISPDAARQIASDVAAAHLPTRVRGLPADDQILASMHHDKKVQAGRLRLVLPEGPARCRVVEDPPLAAVVAGLAAIRA